MEKRLVIFLLCSVLILTGHMLLVRTFAPPRPAAPRDKSAAKGLAQPGKVDAPPADRADQAPQAESPQVEAAGDGQRVARQEDLPAESPPPAEDDQPAMPKVAPQWLSLGSYAADRSGQLLVTLTNRGAAIDRVELVERRANGQLRYRDLDNGGGFPGWHCHDTPRGCTVTVVNAGTPAALAQPDDGTLPAGVMPGDAIVTFDGTAVPDSEALHALLARTRPQQRIELGVLRGEAAAARVVTFAMTLGERPLALIHPETRAEGPTTSSYLVGLHRLGTTTLARGEDELRGIPSLRQELWEVAEATDTEVLFRYRMRVADGTATQDLELRKRFRIMAPGSDPAAASSGYSVGMSLEIVNLGPAPQTVSYALDGATGLPTEGWWYSTKIHPSWGSAGARDVIWRVQGNRHSLRSASEIFKLAQKDPVDPKMSVLTDKPSLDERTLDYLGVDTQYFAAVMLAGTPAAPQPFVCQDAYALPVGRVPPLQGSEVRTLDTTYRFVSPDETLAPGQAVTHDYHLFLGPKAPALLDQYALGDIIEYGWFGWIAKPLSKLLHWFYLIVRNYGLAIIVLTVLVRGAMFPIGRKAARNAQIMQELAPEIKKIKEKYKNDLEKQGQAQRELWKKYNFNPLGGCWLMFLQLPIFIGLYRCLSVDIELRQAPLIPGLAWCSNLAGPDMAWRWQGLLPDFLAAETGWLGPYLNILPIVTIVLFIVQQKLFTPPATDDQTRMQQRMMQYMMVFMGVLFFKVPAGLCVYFIASSLWGIGERMLLPKPRGPALAEGPGQGPGGGGGAPPEPKRPPKLPALLQRLMRKPAAESFEEMRARRRSRR